MSAVLEVTGNITIVSGAVLFATASLGVIRFPDAYTRISAVGTAGGLGIVLIILGVVQLNPSVGSAVVATAIIVLQLATSAIGSMAIARAAYLTGTPAQVRTDDLAVAPGPEAEAG